MKRWMFSAVLACICVGLLPFWMMGMPGNGIESDFGRAWALGANVIFFGPLAIGLVAAVFAVHRAVVPADRLRLSERYALGANAVAALVTLGLVVTILRLMF